MSEPEQEQVSTSLSPKMSAPGEFVMQVSHMSQESTDAGIPVAQSRSSRRVKLSSAFFRNSEGQNEEEERFDGLAAMRAGVNKLMKRPAVDMSLGAIVVLDLYMTCAAIDARASGSSSPGWMGIASIVCLLGYTIEIMAAIFAKGSSVFLEGLFIIDLVIVLSGYSELIIAGSGISLDSISILRILRIARIMRLMKLLRKFRMLKELRKLISMATSCCKTLCWSFLFCFVVMTAWSMAIVEFVNPVVQDLAERGVFDDCDYCSKLTKSVMNANLLLFSTVVAGDAWSVIAVPVVLESPITSIIFVGSLLTIVFGVLNLVVAVVVDVFAEQRLKDISEVAQELEAEEEHDLNLLSKIFTQMDEDNSGGITLDELFRGAKKHPEFRNRLRVMDIDECDLEQLFYMLDIDSDGYIDQDEFTGTLSRWITESKSASRFVKYNMQKSIDDQKEMKGLLEKVSKKLQAFVGKKGAKVSEAEGKSCSTVETQEADVERYAEPLSPSPSSKVMSIAPTEDSLNLMSSGIDAAESFRQWMHKAAVDIKHSELLRYDCDLEDIRSKLTESLMRSEQSVYDTTQQAPWTASRGGPSPKEDLSPRIHQSVSADLLFPRSRLKNSLSELRIEDRSVAERKTIEEFVYFEHT